MKRIEVINNKLIIEIKKTIKDTVVSIIDNGKKIILANLSKDAYDFIKVAFNENYVVIYTEPTLKVIHNSSCTAICTENNQVVKAAYDIKNKVELDLTEETNFNSQRKSILEYMLINKIPATISMILNIINDNDSQSLDEDTKYFIECLTCSNKDITKEQIISYILNEYPQLANYINLSTPVSEELSEEIGKKIGIKLLWFHIIPQQIPLIRKEKLLSEVRDFINSENIEDIPTTCIYPNLQRIRKKTNKK